MIKNNKIKNHCLPECLRLILRHEQTSIYLRYTVLLKSYVLQIVLGHFVILSNKLLGKTRCQIA